MGVSAAKYQGYYARHSAGMLLPVTIESSTLSSEGLVSLRQFVPDILSANVCILLAQGYIKFCKDHLIPKLFRFHGPFIF